MTTKTFSDLTYKEKLSYVICVVAFVFGLLLSVAGMLLPPIGEIHGSVLTFFGMTLTFVGSVLGISQHYTLELEKIKKTIKDNTTTTATGEE